MSETAGHYISFVLYRGGDMREEFDCREGEHAPCRTYCALCVNEDREHCQCAEFDREPHVYIGAPCLYLQFMDATPGENYGGPKTIVRGPDPQPITFTWDIGNYTWSYINTEGT